VETTGVPAWTHRTTHHRRDHLRAPGLGRTQDHRPPGRAPVLRRRNRAGNRHLARLPWAAVTPVREAGEFGLALELALQAQAKWPSSAEVKTYLAETGIQATAGMKSAVAQATVAAKAASAQATTEAKAVADADAKEKAAVAETARQARVVADFEAGTANRTAFVDTINKVAPTAGVFIQGAKRGRGDDTVVLVLRNTWHTQPYQIRLQVAQSLLIMWQRIRNDEKSYVTLTDLMDNVVGSTSVFSGISVDK
jgi:hypothetical protein